jgi:hypothetical protein
MAWLIVAGIAAGGGALTTAYFMGKSAARAEAEIASLKTRIASMERDLMIAGVADLVTETEIASLEKEKAEAEKRIAEYEQELRDRPDGNCILDPADLDRLRFGGKR